VVQRLTTEGGKILALLSVLTLLTSIVLVTYVTRRVPSETARIVMSNAFTATLTALLMRLNAAAGRKRE
jgi:hypothetical protein